MAEAQQEWRDAAPETGDDWPGSYYDDRGALTPLGQAMMDAADAKGATRRQTAIRLLEEAFHLRMNGERAPGGNETWQDWDRRAETFLRDISATKGSECGS
jgi:hypothetical protein